MINDKTNIFLEQFWRLWCSTCKANGEIEVVAKYSPTPRIWWLILLFDQIQNTRAVTSTEFCTRRIRTICNLFWLIILCNLLYFVYRSTSCLNKVVWKLTMHVRCQTGDAHACSVTLYRTIKKNTICWVSYCSCDPETLWLAWFCRQKNMQSITVIFMWGEHHLAHVRHSCWCQVSTGFLIIRSRNLYRCLHGFMCDKTALLVKIS